MSVHRTFLLALGVAVVAVVALEGQALGHGSVSDPPSRAYSCRFLEPDNPACRRAWRANPQALYDWMEVNIGDVRGRHRARIPDGRLCSAGRGKYRALDRPSTAWPATRVRPNRRGKIAVRYRATAPHATRYFRHYITKPGHRPNGALRWRDLELIHDSGRLPARKEYRFGVRMPERSGRHVLYQVWQRSDSPEAFYSCSDVIL